MQNIVSQLLKWKSSQEYESFVKYSFCDRVSGGISKDCSTKNRWGTEVIEGVCFLCSCNIKIIHCIHGYLTWVPTNSHQLLHVYLKRQCQPQCICLHFTLKVMECQQITIINISLVLCRYNFVKMSKYNHRMVEIYDGLKTKTWITLPIKWPPSIVWARNAL
jgi:hypothetical protein